MSDEIETPVDPIRKRLRDSLGDDAVRAVAKEVVRQLERECDEETLEYDFQINQGEMVMDLEHIEKNTTFKFDVRKGGACDKVRKALFAEECNDDELLFIEEFRRNVGRRIVEAYSPQVEQALRDAMFKGQPIPIKLMKVCDFDIVDLSDMEQEHNYQLIIEKKVPQSVLQDGGGGNPVSSELFRINAATGKGFNAIIKEKKAAGDPNYQYVVSATTKKMLWDGQIDMFINFFVKLPGEGVKPPTEPNSDLSA